MAPPQQPHQQQQRSRRRSRRCCSRAGRSSLRGAVKAASLVLHAGAAFISVVALTAGALISGADASTVTAHVWAQVKKLPRYAGYTGVQFTSDTAYQTLYASPANALSLVGLGGFMLAVSATLAAACGSRVALYCQAFLSGLCFIGLVGLSLAAAFGGLQERAYAALQTEMKTWMGSYNSIPTSSTMTNSSTVAFGDVFLDHLQMSRHCCGWSSYRDYPDYVLVPATCCQLNSIFMVVSSDCLKASPAANATGWFNAGCSGLYDQLLTRYAPVIAAACVVLLASTVLSAVMGCLTEAKKDFVRLLREAAME